MLFYTHIHLQHTHRHIYYLASLSSCWLCMRQQFRYLSDNPLSHGLFSLHRLNICIIWMQTISPLSYFLDPRWRPIWTHLPKIVPKSTRRDGWLWAWLGFTNFLISFTIAAFATLSFFYFHPFTLLCNSLCERLDNNYTLISDKTKEFIHKHKMKLVFFNNTINFYCFFLPNSLTRL